MTSTFKTPYHKKEYDPSTFIVTFEATNMYSNNRKEIEKNGNFY